MPQKPLIVITVKATASCLKAANIEASHLLRWAWRGSNTRCNSAKCRVKAFVAEGSNPVWFNSDGDPGGVEPWRLVLPNDRYVVEKR